LIPLALPAIKVFAFKADKGIIALNYDCSVQTVLYLMRERTDPKPQSLSRKNQTYFNGEKVCRLSAMKNY
jgi:hypothetical protein